MVGKAGDGQRVPAARGRAVVRREVKVGEGGIALLNSIAMIFRAAHVLNPTLHARKKYLTAVGPSPTLTTRHLRPFVINPDTSEPR